MRRTKIIKSEVSKRVIEEISCNGCGKKAKHLDCTDIQPFKFDFGFGSRHDLEEWHFDLCDSCVEKLVKSFKIPPQKEDMDWNHTL